MLARVCYPRASLYCIFDVVMKGQLSILEDLESTIDAIVSEHYSVVSRNGKHIITFVDTIADSFHKVLSV